MLEPIVGSCKHRPPFIPDDLLRVKKSNTLQALDNCEDELTKLSEKFYK